MIRHKTGLERLRIFFTGLREYRCRDCDQRFRAPDRRKAPRENPAYADKAVARSA
jgi:tRNA(Ile2) C34 agmatinyltransferase TiaS